MMEGGAQNPPRNGEGDQVKLGGGGPRVLQTPIKQVKRARQLRRQLSLPEVLLLQALRPRPNGLKFRSQFPIGPITADFACLSHRLIIEVDGEAHNCGDQPKRDAARDEFLRQEGFEVMRIAARDVLDNLDGVVSGIVARCGEVGPLHQPAAGPPPRAGEEL
ncbi:MAG: endonuclease domain-containing protein [Sphingomicrobium sp.]